jgi:hypothetical protein
MLNRHGVDGLAEIDGLTDERQAAVRDDGARLGEVLDEALLAEVLDDAVAFDRVPPQAVDDEAFLLRPC